MSVAKIDLVKLESDFAQLERQGVRYRLGGKAPSMSCEPAKIKSIDCSGYVRWALARASNQKLIIPDGSQMQREWAEKNLREVKYSDAAAYMTDKRLFIAFIKPFARNCGNIGHVWLLARYNDGNNGTKAGTMESHGGRGANSRDWNYRTLIREVYSCWEIETVQND